MTSSAKRASASRKPGRVERERRDHEAVPRRRRAIACTPSRSIGPPRVISIASGSRPGVLGRGARIAAALRVPIALAREEPVAEPARPARRGQRVAADHDRHRAVDRLREHVGAARAREGARRSPPRRRSTPRASPPRARRCARRARRRGHRARRTPPRSQPTPMPSVTRPPDKRSSVATSLASTTGLRCGRIRIPGGESDRRRVRADPREPDRAGRGSGCPRRRPCGRPRAYGYSDAYPLGTTTCSTVHTDSRPTSSAMAPSSVAPSGVPNGPTLAKSIPYFIAAQFSAPRGPRAKLRAASSSDKGS